MTERTPETPSADASATPSQFRFGPRLYRYLLVLSLSVAVFSSGLLIYTMADLQQKSSAESWRIASRGLLTRPADRLSGPVAMESASDADSLRVVIAPVISPERSLLLYQDLVNYLAKHVGLEPQLMARSSYAEVNALVRYGHADLALVCTGPFVEGERDFGMEALAMPEVDGRRSYQAFVMVPGSSPARSLMDLRGKRFASSDIGSMSGWLYVREILKSEGESPETFFSDHLFTGGHDRSLEAVLKGYVDGASVHGGVYYRMVSHHPGIAERLKIIHKSPAFGQPPFVVHPGIDPAMKTKLQELLLHMHEDDEGRAALDPLHIDRFLRPDADTYASVREMLGTQCCGG